MFQLSRDETDALVSQNVIASVRSLGGGLPYVFTEQGVAMLSSVLTSRRAVQVNIAIMRTFVKLRQLLENHKDLLQKVGALERTQKEHTVQIKAVFDAIRKLIVAPAEPPKHRIGFQPPADKK